MPRLNHHVCRAHIHTHIHTYTHTRARAQTGQVAYILVGEDVSADKTIPTWCKGVKVASDGKLVASVNYDTGAKNKGLDIHKFGPSGASLAWDVDRNELGLILGRTRTVSEDGITHQGAIAVVLDGVNMKVLKNLDRTSAHSWFVCLFVCLFLKSLLKLSGECEWHKTLSVRVVIIVLPSLLRKAVMSTISSPTHPRAMSVRVGKSGKFLGADLGDNSPRGLNLHEFGYDKTNDKGEKQYSMKSKVVFAYKTRHCDSHPCVKGHVDPVYKEISSDEKTFYQQSNDNSVRAS